MTPNRSELQQAVEQRIGRNLLRYQLVEQRLKLLLPLRKITLSAEGVEALRDQAEKLRIATLGQLLSTYLDPSNTPAGATHLDAFLSARNWLAHHLLADFGMLATDAHCQQCIDRLDQDYVAAETFAREVLDVTRITLKMVKAFMDAWVEAGADLAEGTHLTNAMARYLADEKPISVSVVLPADSVENILAVIMRKLHQERRNADGWTHFSSVGPVARRESPDLQKHGLLALARQVEGFEFELRPTGHLNATWMFRIADKQSI